MVGENFGLIEMELVGKHFGAPDDTYVLGWCRGRLHDGVAVGWA